MNKINRRMQNTVLAYAALRSFLNSLAREERANSVPNA